MPPSEAQWTRSGQPSGKCKVRCKFFDNNGRPSGRGCIYASDSSKCFWVHPDEPNWDTAAPYIPREARVNNSADREAAHTAYQGMRRWDGTDIPRDNGWGDRREKRESGGQGPMYGDTMHDSPLSSTPPTAHPGSLSSSRVGSGDPRSTDPRDYDRRTLDRPLPPRDAEASSHYDHLPNSEPLSATSRKRLRDSPEQESLARSATTSSNKKPRQGEPTFGDAGPEDPLPYGSPSMARAPLADHRPVQPPAPQSLTPHPPFVSSQAGPRGMLPPLVTQELNLVSSTSTPVQPSPLSSHPDLTSKDPRKRMLAQRSQEQGGFAPSPLSGTTPSDMRPLHKLPEPPSAHAYSTSRVSGSSAQSTAPMPTPSPSTTNLPTSPTTLFTPPIKVTAPKIQSTSNADSPGSIASARDRPTLAGRPMSPESSTSRRPPHSAISSRGDTSSRDREHHRSHEGREHDPSDPARDKLQRKINLIAAKLAEAAEARQKRATHEEQVAQIERMFVALTRATPVPTMSTNLRKSELQEGLQQAKGAAEKAQKEGDRCVETAGDALIDLFADMRLDTENGTGPVGDKVRERERQQEAARSHEREKRMARLGAEERERLETAEHEVTRMGTRVNKVYDEVTELKNEIKILRAKIPEVESAADERVQLHEAETKELLAKFEEKLTEMSKRLRERDEADVARDAEHELLLGKVEDAEKELESSKERNRKLAEELEEVAERQGVIEEALKEREKDQLALKELVRTAVAEVNRLGESYDELSIYTNSLPEPPSADALYAAVRDRLQPQLSAYLQNALAKARVDSDARLDELISGLWTRLQPVIELVFELDKWVEQLVAADGGQQMHG